MFLIILYIIGSLGSCSTTNKRSNFYYEHQKEIDAYEEKHKDDWKGYNGCRRNSWAEDENLKADGFDPDEYRKSHGY
jgi:hypothetical protein